jgi:eukaryotic-like serine/threonine-protein kinase
MWTTVRSCPNGHLLGPLDSLCPLCGTLPRGEPVPLATAPGTPPPTVPGYEVLSELGRGGMGVVYRARQVALDRVVALKMIRESVLAGPQERARFRAEAEAVGKLQHPHIVQVFEVGEAVGRPFFSLEYCPGGSLADRLRGAPQPPRAAAGLSETLARAVHAAHQAGIVHRDLKPANVLLTAAGEPKVGDFGLARRLEGETGHTPSRAVLGTPSYMAPEQAEGKARLAGPAADVWALGAILYELLTGRPPFLGETTLDTIQQVLTQEPVAPARLQPKVPRDLETITLKCLEKDPARRYGSAADLADDLARFLRGEPVRARPVGAVGRVARWARRRPAAATLVLVSLLAVAAAGVGTAALFYNSQLADALGRANQQEQEAQAQRGAAEEARGQAEQAGREALDLRARAERQQYFADMALAQRALEDGRIDRVRELLDDHRPGRHTPPDLPGFEWRHLWRLAHQERFTLRGHAGPVAALAFSPDGQRLASAAPGETGVRVWVPTLGKLTLTVGAGASVTGAVAFSPDGRLLAGGCGDGRLRVWAVATGREVRAFKRDRGWGPALAWGPDGKLLAVSEGNGVRVLDADTGQEQFALAGHAGPVEDVAFSPDRKRLATASRDKTVRVWDAATGQPLKTCEGHAQPVHAVAWDADGKRLASASDDRSTCVWDAGAGALLLRLEGHAGPVTGVAWRPDGKRLATASDDRAVKVWDAAGGEEPLTLRGHNGPVARVVFSPDGKLLASASADHTVCLWDGDARTPDLVLKGNVQAEGCVTWSPDGKRLVASQDGVVRAWDPATGAETPLLREPTWPARDLAFSPDGKRLAGAVGADAYVWDVATGKELRSFPAHAAGLNRLAFSPDGKRLATAGDLAARVWDVDAATEVRSFEGHERPVLGVAFSPDGRRLATASLDGTVRVWDAQTGQGLLVLRGATAGCCAVAYSPDGTRLAGASLDNTLVLWDAETGKPVRLLEGHEGPVWAVAFSPDGRRIASASADKTVKVWDAETGREALTVKGHLLEVLGVAFSPDGRQVASAGKDAVRTWHAPPPALPAEGGQGAGQ